VLAHVRDLASDVTRQLAHRAFPGSERLEDAEPLGVGKRPTDEALRQQQMFGADNDDAVPGSGSGGDQPSSLIQEKLGLTAVPLTAQIAAQLGIASGTQGLVIADVDQNSDAARKGLQRGDIILTANYRPTPSVAATMAGGMALGRMTISATRRSLIPSARAASTNSRSS